MCPEFEMSLIPHDLKRLSPRFNPIALKNTTQRVNSALLGGAESGMLFCHVIS